MKADIGRRNTRILLYGLYAKTIAKVRRVMYNTENDNSEFAEDRPVDNAGTINNKLNFLKCFACIGVVFIHITFPGRFGEIVRLGADYAVPVFFMIAGYYAWGKDTAVIKRRLIKMLKILAYAYILHFIPQITAAVTSHEFGMAWLGRYFNWKTPIKFIFFCTVDFSSPLWYLIAMSETYIAWYYLIKKHKEQFALKLLPLLFVLQILLTSFCETLQLEWFLKINFVTKAMPWFLLGYYLHTDKADKLRKLDSWKLILLAVIGCAIAVTPAVVSLPVNFGVVGYIPYAFGLFTLTLKEPNVSVCKAAEFIGEKLSLNIYIFHTLIYKVLVLIRRGIFGINTESDLWAWSCPILVLVCTIFVSWLLYIISGSIKRKNMARNSAA